MSILHIILVKRLVSIVWDPKEARDDTEEYQNKEWSSQLWTQFLQLCKKPEKKNQNFNGRYGNEPKTSTQGFRSLNGKDSSLWYQRCSINRLDRNRSLGR